jgi:hypothetical protein
VQQSRHIRENGNSVMVKCQHSRCRIRSNRTTDAGFQGPRHHHQWAALLWNPPRPLYCYQEKVSWLAHKGCHVTQWFPSRFGLLYVGHVVLHVLEGLGSCPIQPRLHSSLWHLSATPHGVTSQETIISIFTSMRTSDLSLTNLVFL